MPDMVTERIEEIFSDALEITDAAERAAFLQRACVNNPEWLANIEKKLAAYPEAERFFDEGQSALIREAIEAGLFTDSAESISREFEKDDIVGSRIGRYKLLQKIGEGGCGIVYMAEQEKPVRRCVAR